MEYLIAAIFCVICAAFTAWKSAQCSFAPGRSLRGAKGCFFCSRWGVLPPWGISLALMIAWLALSSWSERGWHPFLNALLVWPLGLGVTYFFPARAWSSATGALTLLAVTFAAAAWERGAVSPSAKFDFTALLALLAYTASTVWNIEWTNRLLWPPESNGVRPSRPAATSELIFEGTPALTLAEQLERIARLHRQGLLTETEYKRAKAVTLDSRARGGSFRPHSKKEQEDIPSCMSP